MMRLNRYINSVNRYLKHSRKRVLTTEEEAIVIAHLEETSAAFNFDNVDGFDLMATLCLEAAAKAAEIHPDIEAPSPQQITRAIEAMSKVE